MEEKFGWKKLEIEGVVVAASEDHSEEVVQEDVHSTLMNVVMNAVVEVISPENVDSG